MNYNELQQKIRGIVYPIPPAFSADESLDYEATARYVDYLVNNGAKTLMVTAGTSRFNLMTDDEVSQLNKTVIDASNKRAFVIGANPMEGSTSHAIAFTQQVAKHGADAILIYYPERFYGDDRVLSYFESICNSTELGVMIHANPMRHAVGGNANFSLKFNQRLADNCHNYIGMKEEHGDVAHRYKLATHFSDRLTFVVAGGGMRTFASCYLFGVQATLASIGSFKPQLEEKFYTDLMSGDLKNALKPIRELEEPLFDVGVPIGWHIAMKTVMSLMGLMPIYERAPLTTPTDEEIERLRVLIHTFGWV